MNTNHRHAVAALTAAGLLWGTTVPLSKLALQWLAPGWLTAVRFGLAAAMLLAVTRRGGRGAPRPGERRRGRGILEARLVASGAVGYGGTVVVQNAGITQTSVTHAALLIGAVPVLVAIIAAAWQRSVARPAAWLGFAVSLGGVGLVTAGGGGGGATLRGDGLVLVSLLLSATFTVAQGRLLPGRDPVAVTAAQFLGAALGALAFSVIAEGVPAVPARPGPVLATAALALAGTLAPFTLFAYGQSRVPPEIAGAFLNIEPLVGAIAGVMFFGDPAGPRQLAGGLAVVAGIGLSALVPGRSAGVEAEEGQIGEDEGRRLEVVGQLIAGACAYDQRGHARPPQGPGQRAHPQARPARCAINVVRGTSARGTGVSRVPGDRGGGQRGQAGGEHGGPVTGDGGAVDGFGYRGQRRVLSLAPRSGEFPRRKAPAVIRRRLEGVLAKAGG